MRLAMLGARMRPFVALAAGALLALVALPPSQALAQTTMPMTTAISCPAGWRVRRENSPRSVDFPTTGGVVGLEQQVGLRDCQCGEVLVIEQATPIQPTPAGAIGVQVWVGNSAMACATSTNRMPPSGGIPTCFQLAPESGVPQNSAPTAPNLSFRIPLNYVISPRSGSCASGAPPFGATQTVHLSLLYAGTADPSPLQTCSITYTLTPPTPVASAPTVNAQEGAAQVTWPVGTATDDSGTTSTTAPNLRGFYVLQYPGPAVPRQDASACDASVTPDTSAPQDTGAGADAGDDADLDATSGTDATTTPDTGGGGGMDASAGMDASTGGGTCGSPPAIDPNDPGQFGQYVATDLITAMGMARISGLTNNTAYQFAIVTEDTAGNRSISPWSGCVTPQPVTDFWEQYRNRGGTVQPGFCAVPAATATATRAPWRTRGGAALLAGLAAAALAARRRRRSRGASGDARGDVRRGS